MVPRNRVPVKSLGADGTSQRGAVLVPLLFRLCSTDWPLLVPVE